MILRNPIYTPTIFFKAYQRYATAYCLPIHKDLDKTRAKLFSTFTRHHLITHTNNTVIILLHKGTQQQQNKAKAYPYHTQQVH